MLTAAGRILTTTAVAGAAAAVWGVGIERHLYTLRHATAEVLPAGAAPIRVLHISDAHMAPWQRRKQAWIASLASLRPDLIVNTGDNLGHEHGLRGIRAAFAGFRRVPGVYVHGSNDLWAPSPRNPFRYIIGPSKKDRTATPLDTAAMERYFEQTLGWGRVENAATSIVIRGTRLDIVGVGDAHQDRDRLDLLPGLAAGLRDEGSEEPRLTIGVAHAPYRRVLDAFVAAGADVLFAGHTHGGQVRLPGYGALVSNCDLPTKQARGLSTWTSGGRSVPLHVSAGLGHSIYSPVRFACRPEATLLTLTPRPGDTTDFTAPTSVG